MLSGLPPAALAADPAAGTLNAPAGTDTVSVSWSGGPYTVATPDPAGTGLGCVHSLVNCDLYELTVTFPNGSGETYWEEHLGEVTVRIDWAQPADDFDMYIYDAEGNFVDSSTSGNTTNETITIPQDELTELTQTFSVRVLAWLTTDASYTGTATVNAVYMPPAMRMNEDRNTIMDMLTVDYPLNVIFVGYHPTPQEVADLKAWIPETYQPTVAAKSSAGDEVQNEGAGLLNWNKNHLITSEPYFLGIRYNYQVRIIQASDDYARALFQVAENNTA
jgi:hypothetical protein